MDSETQMKKVASNMAMLAKNYKTKYDELQADFVRMKFCIEKFESGELCPDKTDDGKSRLIRAYMLGFIDSQSKKN